MALFDSHNVDYVICAGDLVDGGYDGDAVVECIKEQKIPTVQCNHDRDMFTEQARIRRQLKFTGEATHPYLLHSNTVGFLASLPLVRYFEWAGHRICLAHGTPTSATQYLFPENHEQQFKDVVENATADIVILGHTHLPMQVNFDDIWILNPGSASRNRTDLPSRTCAILTLPDVTFTVFDIDSGAEYPLYTIILTNA